MMNDMAAISESQTSTRWRPLESIERRVLGVLIEKAKTTPENYPLSLNALRSGCNQKNNRAPLMQLEEERVEEAIESLRKHGAVAVIQGSGRVDKYRHLAYEWLGVDKIELAVIAELLLRGDQTVGELRGRAARMEPIKDLSDLRPVLDALEAKGLIVYLTPTGRGCIVTHALYQDREMEKLRREIGSAAADDRPHDAAPQHTTEARLSVHSTPADLRAASTSSRDAAADEVVTDLARLRSEVSALRAEFIAARAEFESHTQALRRELDELNRQLGN